MIFSILWQLLHPVNVPMSPLNVYVWWYQCNKAIGEKFFSLLFILFAVPLDRTWNFRWRKRHCETFNSKSPPNEDIIRYKYKQSSFIFIKKIFFHPKITEFSSSSSSSVSLSHFKFQIKKWFKECFFSLPESKEKESKQWDWNILWHIYGG